MERRFFACTIIPDAAREVLATRTADFPDRAAQGISYASEISGWVERLDKDCACPFAKVMLKFIHLGSIPFFDDASPSRKEQQAPCLTRSFWRFFALRPSLVWCLCCAVVYVTGSSMP